MDIELANLRKSATAVFDHLERLGVQTVNVDGPMYWNIQPTDRYSMTHSPVDLDVGSLYDDYSDLVRVASGEQQALAAHLKPLAAILEAMGALLSTTLAGRGG